jgi:tripartite-type tricarboxylate transporter receptor subunit TctC
MTMRLRSTRRSLLAAALAMPALAPPVRAQAPSVPLAGPVRVVVPYPAGGVTDALARLASERLAARIGIPFVVDNRSGAGGAIALEYVVNSPPTGQTLFFGGAGDQFNVVPRLQKTRFQPRRDLTPIAIVAVVPQVLTVHASLPVQSLPELIAHVKARPGQVSYASGGIGGMNHLEAALFSELAGLEMVHVPYRGGVPAVQDLLAGRVQLYFANPSDIIQHRDRGVLRPLATTGAQRLPALPELPTLGETYPGYSFEAWNAFLAPTGTPAPVIALLAGQVQEILQEEAVRRRILEMGVLPSGAGTEALATLMAAEAPRYEAAMDAAKLSAD